MLTRRDFLTKIMQAGAATVAPYLPAIEAISPTVLDEPLPAEWDVVAVDNSGDVINRFITDCAIKAGDIVFTDTDGVLRIASPSKLQRVIGIGIDENTVVVNGAIQINIPDNLPSYYVSSSDGD